MTTVEFVVTRRQWSALNAELVTQGAPRVKAGERQWVEFEHDDVTWDAYDMALALIDRRRKQQQLDVDTERTKPTELEALTLARSELRADVARADTDVQWFRQHVLDGQLLALDDVEAFVQRQHRHDHRVSQRPTPVNVPTPMLDFTADGRQVERVPVTADGVLGQVRTLSERLARQHAWQPAQAATFVLTDATPVVSMLRTTARTGTRQRVVLDVDPDVPADVVAAAYVQAKRQLLGPKPRTPSARAVELVRFAADHPNWKPAQLWKQWNDSHDEHEQYRTVPAIRQALADARRRVDGEPRRRR